MQFSDWILIIIGIIIGLLLIRGVNNKDDEDELDDWDQQDQLEDDKV